MPSITEAARVTSPLSFTYGATNCTAFFALFNLFNFSFTTFTVNFHPIDLQTYPSTVLPMQLLLLQSIPVLHLGHRIIVANLGTREILSVL